MATYNTKFSLGDWVELETVTPTHMLRDCHLCNGFGYHQSVSNLCSCVEMRTVKGRICEVRIVHDVEVSTTYRVYVTDPDWGRFVVWGRTDEDLRVYTD